MIHHEFLAWIREINLSRKTFQNNMFMTCSISYFYSINFVANNEVLTTYILRHNFMLYEWHKI